MAKPPIETDIDKLLASMEGWKHGDTPTFQELCASTLSHLATGDGLRGAVRSIADSLAIQAFTVQWWASGIARPHPRLQPLIIQKLRQHLLLYRDKA